MKFKIGDRVKINVNTMLQIGHSGLVEARGRIIKRSDYSMFLCYIQWDKEYLDKKLSANSSTLWRDLHYIDICHHLLREEQQQLNLFEM